MAHTIRLDIYDFRLRRITETGHRMMRGEIRPYYKTESEDCEFEDFVKSLSHGVDDNDYMRVFLESFINGFNNAFAPNENNTQAMSITTELYKGYNSAGYTAWGNFIGGATGINYDVYKNNNASEKTGTVDENSVASLRYFYKIWIPKDSNVGILMIQSYTSGGCTVLFREQLEQYFIKTGYRMFWSKCIPQSYIDNYFKNGYINEIQVLYSNRNQEEPLSPDFQPFKEAKRRAVFKNLSICLPDFIAIKDYQSVMKAEIKSIDLNYQEDDDIVKLYYTCNGRSANTTLANIEDILPIITLDESFYDDIAKEPKWEEMHKFTDELLDKIKIQMSYTPKAL